MKRTRKDEDYKAKCDLSRQQCEGERTTERKRISEEDSGRSGGGSGLAIAALPTEERIAAHSHSIATVLPIEPFNFSSTLTFPPPLTAATGVCSHVSGGAQR